ncbi:MAG: type II toxin-antitoxin system RelE/ParE family toxin [Clostridium sp.]
MNVDQHYKVIISDRARRILASHIRFMTKVNKDVAKDMKKIMDAMRSLNQMPQRFPFFNEPYITPNKYRKIFVKKWYIVLYQIKDDKVYVDYIIDCHQNYDWLMK